jgi:hypothetical protein
LAESLELQLTSKGFQPTSHVLKRRKSIYTYSFYLLLKPVYRDNMPSVGQTVTREEAGSFIIGRERQYIALHASLAKVRVTERRIRPSGSLVRQTVISILYRRSNPLHSSGILESAR